MDNELKEMLKDLLNNLGEKIDQMGDFNIGDEISKGFKQPAKLSIEKFEDGKSILNVEGTNLAILITLAGLEKAVLKKLNQPRGLWDLIKHSVETMEAGDNE